MNEQIEHAKQAIEAAASNPKVATLVAGGTASTGLAAKFHFITGIVADVTVWIAACTATLVCAIQLVKFIREWRRTWGRK